VDAKPTSALDCCLDRLSLSRGSTVHGNDNVQDFPIYVSLFYLHVALIQGVECRQLIDVAIDLARQILRVTIPGRIQVDRFDAQGDTIGKVVDGRRVGGQGSLPGQALEF
jgi:hypothetical protein